MDCQRCRISFCWCCMRTREAHRKCDLFICPEIPFGFTLNLLLTIGAALFSIPAGVLFAIGYAFVVPCDVIKLNHGICSIILLVMYPASVAFCAAFLLAALVLAIVPFYVLIFLYLIRWTFLVFKYACGCCY